MSEINFVTYNNTLTETPHNNLQLTIELDEFPLRLDRNVPCALVFCDLVS